MGVSVAGTGARVTGQHEGYTIHEPSVVLRPESVRIGDGSRVDAFCKIEGGQGVRIGRHVHIASFCHLNAGGGELVIEDCVALSSGVVVCSGQPDLEGKYGSPVAPNVPPAIRMSTTLREGAVLFARSVVLPGVTVGRFAVVGAGAVVTKDVPDGEVWMGVPARKVSDRRTG